MCGVAALLRFNSELDPSDKVLLNLLCNELSDRGPDGNGSWSSDKDGIILGHTRLAILDLSDRGAQPMTHDSLGISISYNGEIYNFRTLRSQLQKRGYTFRSTSDTEVLLNMYLEYGDQMFEQLQGMYAIVIWDPRKKAVVLARDPYGIKPLYYALNEERLLVASQVQAIVRCQKQNPSISSAGIVGFYLIGSVPEPHTIIEGILTVPPGHTLTFSREGKSAKKCFFSVAEVFQQSIHCDQKLSQQEAIDRIGSALRRSIQSHLVSDVPIGLFLSAGIDSCAILAHMTETTPPETITTMTLRFDEFSGQNRDESVLAEEFAGAKGTNHVTSTLTNRDFVDTLPRFFEAMDQPTTDGLNTWLVSNVAKQQGLKVALSGLGGDELFAGYPSFTQIPLWVSLTSKFAGWRSFSRSVRKTTFPLFSLLGVPKAASLLEYGGSFNSAYLLKRSIFLPWELPDILPSETVADGLKKLQNTTHSCSDHPVPYNEVAALESTIYMKNQLLRDSDWAGMAHSLEIRVPFVDTNLLSECARVVSSSSPKHAKEYVARYEHGRIPESIFTRKKTGFDTPIASWLRNMDEYDVSFSSKRKSWAKTWAQIVMQQYLGKLGV